MPKGFKEMLAEANAEVSSIEAAEMASKAGDTGLTLVDIRDIRELERDGMIEGAMHAPRGMLEFWIDPESPYHKAVFAEDKTFVFYCASGWRSLLAAQTALRMGLKSMSMRGGFREWKKLGHPVAEKNSREKQSR